ncbi:hypothetical protein VTN96DRAFT_4167 [Rasamsonia emersonii]
MSDPYYQHSCPPQPGYPPSGGQYHDPAQAQQPPYGYASQPPQDPNTGYQHPQGSYQPPVPYQGGGATEGFGPPRRQDSFGPPTVGGFQHGYEGGQFGAYNASNPQGHPGYYGGPPPDTRGYSPSPSPHPQPPQYDPNNPQHQQPPPPPAGESAPADPNAPEGERGLGSSLLGGAAGYYIGHKHNHGLLGAVGGALLGNFIGDKLEKKHHEHGHGHHHKHHHSHHSHHHHHSSHSSHHGGSSHGDSSWGSGW